MVSNATSNTKIRNAEKEIQLSLRKQAKIVFGEETIYLHLIRRKVPRADFANIPNGYVIALNEPIWCIVAIELAGQSCKSTNPRLNRFCLTIKSSSAQKELVNILLNEIHGDESLRSQVQDKIASADIKGYLQKLFSKPPRIIVIVDEMSNKIREAYEGLIIEPALLAFKKFVEEKSADAAYLFGPLPCDEIGAEYDAQNPTHEFIRLKPGEYIPQKEYELPLLESIIELGGRATLQEALNKLYDKMKDRMKDSDCEALPSSCLRWEKQAQWMRHHLKKRGYIKTGSPVGLWEITDEGKKYYKSHKQMKK